MPAGFAAGFRSAPDAQGRSRKTKAARVVFRQSEASESVVMRRDYPAGVVRATSPRYHRPVATATHIASRMATTPMQSNTVPATSIRRNGTSPLP